MAALVAALHIRNNFGGPSAGRCSMQTFQLSTTGCCLRPRHMPGIVPTAEGTPSSGAGMRGLRSPLNCGPTLGWVPTASACRVHTSSFSKALQPSGRPGSRARSGALRYENRSSLPGACVPARHLASLCGRLSAGYWAWQLLTLHAPYASCDVKLWGPAAGVCSQPIHRSTLEGYHHHQRRRIWLWRGDPQLPAFTTLVILVNRAAAAHWQPCQRPCVSFAALLRLCSEKAQVRK